VAVIKRVLDGTTQPEFTIGIDGDEVGIRSNGGVIQLRNNGGGYFTPSGGGTTWAQEIFVITGLDVANGYLDLAASPIANSELVVINGIVQYPGVSFQYTVSGNRVTFLFTLMLSSTVMIKYQL